MKFYDVRRDYGDHITPTIAKAASERGNQMFYTDGFFGTGTQDVFFFDRLLSTGSKKRNRH